MSTMEKIVAAVEAALKIATAGMDIVNRFKRGELTEEQASAEWERTRQLYAKGAQAWDEAGR